jgi:hypothetical protein
MATLFEYTITRGEGEFKGKNQPNIPPLAYQSKHLKPD